MLPQCTRPCQSVQQALRRVDTDMLYLSLSQGDTTSKCRAWTQTPTLPKVKRMFQPAIVMTSACSVKTWTSVSGPHLDLVVLVIVLNLCQRLAGHCGCQVAPVSAMQLHNSRPFSALPPSLRKDCVDMSESLWWDSPAMLVAAHCMPCLGKGHGTVAKFVHACLDKVSSYAAGLSTDSQTSDQRDVDGREISSDDDDSGNRQYLVGVHEGALLPLSPQGDLPLGHHCLRRLLHGIALATNSCMRHMQISRCWNKHCYIASSSTQGLH